MAAMFTAVIIACLGLAQKGEAAVTWLVSQVGDDVVMVTSGDLQVGVGGSFVRQQNEFLGAVVAGGGVVVKTGLTDTLTNLGVAGTNIIADPFIIDGNILTVLRADVFTGDSFGHHGVSGNLFLDPSDYSGSATTITPVSSMTYFNVTVADLFATNLDNGPVVVWTASVTGDTIQFALAAVPEPSSTALLGLGGLALMLRRRR